MSFPERRMADIQDNVSNLIKSLTKFEETDENLSVCEQFALSKIRYSNYLSVNSHEVRRKIDGLLERLRISNYSKYADNLNNLCSDLTTHPLCENHYEKDIQWSILCFFLEICTNPVSTIRINAKAITNDVLVATAAKSAEQIERETLVKLLQEDNYNVPFEKQIEANKDSSESSELSDWSDSEEEQDNSKDILQFQNSGVNEAVFAELTPPTKALHSKPFDDSTSEQWVFANIQTSWWKNKNGYDGGQQTTSEYCLIREIIFMFLRPANCKYFSVVNDNKVQFNNCVTLSSTIASLKIVQKFLAKFSHYMTLMLQLKQFCKIITEPSDFMPPHTYECYAKGLQQCLQPFVEFLISTEQKTMEQGMLPVSIINLYHEMLPHLEMLENLSKIHEVSVLDFRTVPFHICSSRLIAVLLYESTRSTTTSYANLSISLFLITIEVYLRIIDTWWTEGRLDDWRNEFLIKRSDGENLNILHGFEVQQLKDEKNLQPTGQINDIANNVFIKLLVNHLMEAGYSLNILTNLDRVSEIKNKRDSKDNLYKTFFQMVVKKISSFECIDSSENDLPNIVDNESLSGNNTEVESISLFRQELLATGGAFLLMAFEKSLSLLKTTKETASVDTAIDNAYKIYQSLTSTTSMTLPFESIISGILTNLLESKISVANNCVLKLYTEEFKLAYHLDNLRKVYLFEASDLMFTFYSSLFKEIEAGDNWNNSYLLTLQLNGILSTKYPEMSSAFSVHVPPNIDKKSYVLQAIQEISIKYAVDQTLQNILNDTCWEQYNKVFRFLLKLKWGIWTLENLRFPTFYKKQRQPYVQMNRIDLTFTRLALVRNWLMYSIKCIHSHLMIQVVETFGQKLIAKIKVAKNLIEIIHIHEVYIRTIFEYCFQSHSDENIQIGIDQLLNLIYVVRNEWNSINVARNGCAPDDLDGSVAYQIDTVETTYIKCHCYLSELFCSSVYSRNKIHLSGLSAAFSSSCPF